MATLDRGKVDEALRELEALVIDRNRLIVDYTAIVGGGGYAVVHEAKLLDSKSSSRQSSRQVAVKQLRSDPGRDLRVAYSLLREVKLWSTLNHPNVLELLGFNLSPSLDSAWLVCPLQPMGSVDGYLKANRVDLASRMGLISQTLSGLIYLHQLNVVHGDIKAANTLVNEKREAVLCDFGLAKSSSPSGFTTSSDNFKGSMPWCSPELVNEEGPRSIWSDIWAWACLVLEIMKERLPYQDFPHPKMIASIAQGLPPEQKSKLQAPVDLWDLLRHCWHYRAEDRLTAVQCEQYWSRLRADTHGILIEDHTCPPPTDSQRTQSYALIEMLRRADRADFRCEGPNAHSACLEGTRDAILERIEEWLKSVGPGVPPIFWVDGIAGIGKSTIAKTIALRAFEYGCLGASFPFSRRGEPELRDPTIVFPTIAYQLAAFSPAFARYLGDELEGVPVPNHGPYETQVHQLFIKPLRSLAYRKTPVVLVMDALDECEQTGLKTVLSLLLDAVPQLPFPLKLLVTSRPEPHIRTVFKRSKMHEKIILHDMEASIVESDVKLYLHARLRAIPSELDMEMEMGCDWFTPEELDLLVELSGKLFVYAATALRFIGDGTVRNPRRQLQILLDIRHASSNLLRPYATLDQLYLEVITTALSTLNLEHVIPRFHVAVGAVILLRAQLSVTEMDDLLGKERGYVRNALWQLHSVIITPESDSEPPRTYHKSFPDFLTDPNRCVHPCRIDVEEEEGYLAVRCLTILNTYLKRNIADIQTWPPLLNEEVEDFPTKVAAAVEQPLRYACLYWATHLSSARPGHPLIVQLLEKFAAEGILMWLEVLSLLGQVTLGTTSAKAAGAWATSSDCSARTVGVLRDAVCFTAAFGTTVASGPEFIYLSALPFCPKESVLFKTYEAGLTLTVEVASPFPVGGWPEPGHDVLRVLGHPSEWDGRILGSAQGLALSADGSCFASVSEDGAVRTWDTASRTCTTTFKCYPDSNKTIPDPSGHPDPPFVLAFSADGTRLASMSMQAGIQLWDVVSGTRLATMKGSPGFVTSLAVSPDGAYLAAGSLNVRTYEAASGACITTSAENDNNVKTLIFSPDGRRLASAESSISDREPVRVRMWDVMTGACIATLGQFNSRVDGIGFSLDGSYLFTSSRDGIYSWKIVDFSRERVDAVPGHIPLCREIDISSDKMVYVTSQKGRFRVCHLPDAVEAMTFYAQDGIALIGCPDGRTYILSFSEMDI